VQHLAEAGEPDSMQQQQQQQQMVGSNEEYDVAGEGSLAAGLRRACSETGQINDIKRMSIDEGSP
jgi:hypothetical protein